MSPSAIAVTDATATHLSPAVIHPLPDRCSRHQCRADVNASGVTAATGGAQVAYAPKPAPRCVTKRRASHDIGGGRFLFGSGPPRRRLTMQSPWGRAANPSY